jgi:hypothetical protein
METTSKFSRKQMRNLLTLACKTVLIFAYAGIILQISAYYFTKYTSWETFMDPRKCLLWRGHFDGTRYVMIGDSAFCSYYVDSPNGTIWARVEALTNDKVFPGALDGARPADFVNQARLIAASWPQRATVFSNLTPTKLLNSKLPEAADGNYDEQFKWLIPNNKVWGQNPFDKLYYFAGKTSFFLLNDNALKSLIDGIFAPPAYYRRNRVWNRSGDFAIKRFRLFEKNIILQNNDDLRSVDWMPQVRNILMHKGIRAVFVLTPLNKKLISTYAASNRAHNLVNQIDIAHNKFRSFVRMNKLDLIDLYDDGKTDEFADMVHTNENGDNRIAQMIAAWIKGNKNIAPAAKIPCCPDALPK